MATISAICLNMIVRDEAAVVETALECVAGHVSYWVVVDTGSQDDTPDVVRRYFAARGIPGELHERPWRDFGQNRSEALALCRGRAEYAWVMDADDRVVGTPPLADLRADCYLLRFGPSPRYWRPQLFRTTRPWRYEGAVHEYVTCAEPYTQARLDGDYHVDSRRLGARSRAPDTYRSDARLLREQLAREPGHPRWTFYLAQSLFDAGDYAAAAKWYARRAALEGWREEVFYSLLRVAECRALLGEPWAAVEGAYLDASRVCPERAEPLLAIATQHRRAGDPEVAYEFAARAHAVPPPDDDALFVATDAYDWRTADELAYCAFRTGRVGESIELWEALVRSDALPRSERDRVNHNLGFARAMAEHGPVRVHA